MDGGPASFVVVLRGAGKVEVVRDDRLVDEVAVEVEEPDATMSPFGVLALQAPLIPPTSTINARKLPVRRFAMHRRLDGSSPTTR